MFRIVPRFEKPRQGVRLPPPPRGGMRHDFLCAPYAPFCGLRRLGRELAPVLLQLSHKLVYALFVNAGEAPRLPRSPINCRHNGRTIYFFGAVYLAQRIFLHRLRPARRLLPVLLRVLTAIKIVACRGSPRGKRAGGERFSYRVTSFFLICS